MPGPPPGQAANRFRDAAGRLVRRFRFLIGFVLVPVAVAAFYLFVLAHDRFQAEARFTVRSPDFQSSAALGALLAGTDASRSTEDAYAINSYLQSQDALAALERAVDVGMIFGRASRDPLWRFPRPFVPDSSQERYRLYQRLVTVIYDKTSGITSLVVQAFTAEDAAAIARALLGNAEAMANRMSVRAREDAARQADEDLRDARKRSIAALDRLTEYRNRERVIDPTRISNAVIETIARLSLEIALTRAQLLEVQRAAGQSPQIQTFRTRIAALERQVEIERGQLAGTDGALAGKIAEFELLSLEKDFADKLLTAAVNSAEAARLDVVRQRLYLERVVVPSRPDYPEGPRRWLLLAIVAALGLLAHAAYGRIRRAEGARRRLG